MNQKAVEAVQIKFSLSLEETLTVCSYLGIAGRIDSEEVAEQLADEIKAAILLHKRSRGAR
jgi:hypothetical protein